MKSVEEVIELRDQAIQQLLEERQRLRGEQQALMERAMAIDESLRLLGYRPVPRIDSLPPKARAVATPSYRVEDHLASRPADLVATYLDLEKQILGLGQGIERRPHKWFVAFRTHRNFCGIALLKSKLVVYLDIPFASLTDPRQLADDFSRVGRWPTGETRFSVIRQSDVEYAVSLIRQSYELHRGN